MAGSVRWRAGAWRLQVRGRDGKWVTRTVRADNTRAGRAAANLAMAELVIALAKSRPDDPSGAMTVSELVDRWRQHKAPSWSPSHAEGVAAPAAHVARLLGSVRIDRVRVLDVDDAYARLLSEGKSPATIRQAHSVLRGAFGQAVRWRLVGTNPVVDASPPRLAHRTTVAPTDDDVRALIAAIGVGAYRTLAVVATATGARRGELCALRWPDVALDTGSILFSRSLSGRGLVERQTKTGSTKRVALDPGTVAVLRAHRVAMMERAMRCGVRLDRAAHVWSDDPRGSTPWAPSRVTHWWGKHRATVAETATDDAGRLLAVRWHDLRHYHATVLLAAGVPATVVAQRLGHSSPSVTLGVYGHVVAGQDQEAADIIGAKLHRS